MTSTLRGRSLLFTLTTAFAFLLATSAVVAQNAGTIVGEVTDASTAAPLQGVEVGVVGSSLTSITNADGRYRIAGVPAGDVVVRARMLGYRSLTQPARLAAGGTATVNFELGVSVIALEGMVITATGAQRKREVSTAVSTVNTAELNEKISPINVTDLIQGQATGVTISSASGAVGNAANIRIRGNSSINLDNTPLVYVDGARISTDARDRSVGGADTDRMLDINPEDIESIEIVKGPAAATLYGTEAAAGVIRITTKKGKAGQAQITVRTEFGTNWDPNDYPMRAWNPYVDVGPEYADTTYYIDSLKGEAGFSGADSYYDPFRTGLSNKVSVAMRGGTDDYTYYTSFDRSDREGVFATNGQTAYNMRANFSFQPTENLEVQLSNGFTSSATDYNYNDGESWGYVGAPLLASPQWAPVSVRNPAGGGQAVTCPRAYEEARVTGQSLSELTTSMCDFDRTFVGRNNYDRLKTMANQLEVERFVGSGTITYRPTGQWTNRFTAGYDSYGERGYDMIPNSPLKVRDSDPDRQVSHVQGRVLTLDATSSLRYEIGTDWAAETTVGGQFYRSQQDETDAHGINFPPGAETVGNSAATDGDEFFSEVRTLGFFLQQQFSFRDRLFITPAVRYDDNSAFGANLGSIIYPKIGASWVVSEEQWFPGFADQLRLRAAWGTAGKQPGPFDAVTLLAATSVTLPDGSSASGFEPRRLGNLNLKPETGVELELGFDANFLAGRLGLEFTYFDQVTRDALVLRPVPPSLGFVDGVWDNVGEVTNRGFEAALDGQLLQTEALDWSARLGYTYVSSEITELAAPIAIGGRGLQEHREGYAFGAYFMRPVTLDAAGNVVVADEREFVGQPTPKYDGSLSSTLTLFDNLQLYAVAGFQGGNKTVNYTEVYQCRTAFHTCAAKYERDENGNPTEMARLKSDPAANFQPYHFTYDASFVRLRSLSARYRLPTAWAGVLRAQSASVNVTGTNLLLWTDYPGVDPEINSQGRENASQREFFSAGQTAGVTFGLNLSF